VGVQGRAGWATDELGSSLCLLLRRPVGPNGTGMSTHCHSPRKPASTEGGAEQSKAQIMA